MIALHIVSFVLIIYLLYSNRLQKVRTSNAIKAIDVFGESINNHFESVVNHIGNIKKAIQVIQLSTIEENVKAQCEQSVVVEKIDTQDPKNSIVSLGELIPPE